MPETAAWVAVRWAEAVSLRIVPCLRSHPAELRPSIWTVHRRRVERKERLRDRRALGKRKINIKFEFAAMLVISRKIKVYVRIFFLVEFVFIARNFPDRWSAKHRHESGVISRIKWRRLECLTSLLAYWAHRGPTNNNTILYLNDWTRLDISV